MNLKYIIRWVVALTLLLGFAQNTFGQEKDIPKELYAAAGIPDSLREKANSVIRYNLEEYNVEGPGKCIHKLHSLITVLNEKADDLGVIQIPYNKKTNTISTFEVRVYDEKGLLIKKYHKGDMYDGAASMESTLVNDERYLAVKHSFANFPETIEIIIEEDINSMVNLGEWEIQSDEQAVQQSYCRVSIASDAGFKYLNRNTNIVPEKTVSGNKDIYLWHASNIKAFKQEEGSVSWRVIPVVRFKANKFEHYGYPGDFTSWQSFGKWFQNLNADVENLSPQRMAEIKKMTDTITTPKAKARFLYKYLQNNMRYVNVVLGIGGLKPLAATFVDEKKYGDCKALSNYMRAMLKAVDIKSYYTIVNAGNNAEPEDYSFPFDVSNHIILCIPFKNDTTWLECTSTKAEFGVLGPFTENRNALLITEDGGKLVNTPRSQSKDNQFNSEVHLHLLPDGGAKATILINATGEYRLEYIELNAIKLDDQKEFWQRVLDIKQPTVFDYDPGKDSLYTKHVNLNLEYDKFCDVIAGDKQFYRAMVFPLFRFTAPVEETRVNDYYFDFPLQKSCVTTIDLPPGYEVESLPANANLKFTNGIYTLNYVYNKDKNQVIGTAKFELTNQVIPAAKYNEMQQFMDNVAKAQNKKLVIKKKA